MRIAEKLGMHTLILALFTVIFSTMIVGGGAYYTAKRTLEGEESHRLVSVRDIKKDQIEKRFQSIQRKVTLIANDPIVTEATKKFIHAYEIYDQEMQGFQGVSGFKSNVIKHYLNDFAKSYEQKNGGITIDPKPLINFKDNTSFALQYHYILNNPNPVSREESLDYVADNSTYSKVHKQYHPRFRDLMHTYDFYDIAIVDSITGRIVYSTFKDFDYTTSLMFGPYSQTGLGKIFRIANKLEKNQSLFGDFEPYLPAFDQTIGFIGEPIFDGEERIGVLLIKLSVNSVNATMTNYGHWQQYGLGKTGESYLVGKDYKMRSMSRFFIEDPTAYLAQMKKLGVDRKTLTLMQEKNTSISLQTVKTPGAIEAFKGKTGVASYQDYRNTWVLAAYAPLKIKGLNWIIMVEMDQSEIFAPVKKLAWEILMYGIVIAVLMTVVAVYFGSRLGKQIVGPIQDFSDVINELAHTRDLTKRIQVHSTDELAQMANSLNQLLGSLQVSFQETMESSEKIKAAANKLRGFAKNIDSNLAEREQNLDQLDNLANTTEDLEVLSNKLQNLSDQFRIFEEESDRKSNW